MMIKIESASVSFYMECVLLSKISRHGTPGVFIYSDKPTQLLACLRLQRLCLWRLI